MWDYGTAHAISEIITQADVRIKNLVRTRDFFFGLGPEMAMTPNPQITLFRTHLIDRHKLQAKMWAPYPIFLPRKRSLKRLYVAITTTLNQH